MDHSSRPRLDLVTCARNENRVSTRACAGVRADHLPLLKVVVPIVGVVAHATVRADAGADLPTNASFLLT